MKSRLSFATLAILVNVIFWMAFVVLSVTGSHQYRQHRPAFEEVTPSYIFFGKALQQYGRGLTSTFDHFDLRHSIGITRRSASGKSLLRPRRPPLD